MRQTLNELPKISLIRPTIPERPERSIRSKKSTRPDPPIPSIPSLAITLGIVAVGMSLGAAARYAEEPEFLRPASLRGPLASMTKPNSNDGSSHPGLLATLVLTAMAAGMGWGIRGQYGHETGAMIAGTLASLTLIMRLAPGASSLAGARAAAMMTVAIGMGGSMTYGQTVGLTHDRTLVGNWEALRWGLLGLFIKGGIWIGFAGAFLGMGLGGKRYRPVEAAILMTSLVALTLFGIRLINSPFDPANRVLPRFYFSGDWYFFREPNLKPRPEVWGGLLTALVGLTLYARLVRGDRLAGRMSVIGFVAGGVGFSGGQCVQAFHAWNRELFTTGALSSYQSVFRYFNWWNMMETTFGLVFGAILAAGLWSNRSRISENGDAEDVSLSPTFEMLLFVLHLSLLLTSEFLSPTGSWSFISLYTQIGPLMCILPMIGIVGGRYWPYLTLLPVVAAPICGKSIRALSFQGNRIPPGIGWIDLVQIPMAISLVAATWLACRSHERQPAGRFAAIALLVTTGIYFGLNTVFFDYAWPWKEWTARTPNQLINTVCATCLILAALVTLARSRAPGTRAQEI